MPRKSTHRSGRIKTPNLNTKHTSLQSVGLEESQFSVSIRDKTSPNLYCVISWSTSKTVGVPWVKCNLFYSMGVFYKRSSALPIHVPVPKLYLCITWWQHIRLCRMNGHRFKKFIMSTETIDFLHFRFIAVHVDKSFVIWPSQKPLTPFNKFNKTTYSENGHLISISVFYARNIVMLIKQPEISYHAWWSCDFKQSKKFLPVNTNEPFGSPTMQTKAWYICL